MEDDYYKEGDSIENDHHLPTFNEDDINGSIINNFYIKFSDFYDSCDTNDVDAKNTLLQFLTKFAHFFVGKIWTFTTGLIELNISDKIIDTSLNCHIQDLKQKSLEVLIGLIKNKEEHTIELVINHLFAYIDIMFNVDCDETKIYIISLLTNLANLDDLKLELFHQINLPQFLDEANIFSLYVKSYIIKFILHFQIDELLSSSYDSCISFLFNYINEVKDGSIKTDFYDFINQNEISFNSLIMLLNFLCCDKENALNIYNSQLVRELLDNIFHYSLYDSLNITCTFLNKLIHYIGDIVDYYIPSHMIKQALSDDNFQKESLLTYCTNTLKASYSFYKYYHDLDLFGFIITSYRKQKEQFYPFYYLFLFTYLALCEYEEKILILDTFYSNVCELFIDCKSLDLCTIELLQAIASIPTDSYDHEINLKTNLLEDINFIDFLDLIKDDETLDQCFEKIKLNDKIISEYIMQSNNQLSE